MPTLKLKVLPHFPARVIGGDGITITKTDGVYTVSTDASLITSSPFHIDVATTGIDTGLVGATSITVNDNTAITAGPAGDGHENPDGASGTEGGFIAHSGLVINYTAGGTNSTFNRGAAFLNVWVDSPNNPSDVTGGYFQSLFMSATTSTNSNGTPGAPRGFLYNMGAQAIVQSAATHWHSVVGYQQDICVKALATVENKCALFLTQMIDDAVRGSVYDACIMFGTSTDGITPPPGWKYLLCSSSMGNGGGQFPISADGTYIGALGGTFANFVDISAATVTGQVFKFSTAQKSTARSDLGVPGLPDTNTWTGQQNFVQAGDRAIGVYSLNAAQETWLAVGRSVDELQLGAAGATDDFMTGTVAGDGVIKAVNNLHLGIGTTPMIKLAPAGVDFYGRVNFINANDRATGAYSLNAAQKTWIAVGRSVDELQLGAVGATNDFLTGTAVGDSAIKAVNNLHIGVGTTSSMKVVSTGVEFPGTNSFTAGNTFTRADNPAISVRSGASGSFPELSIGRTATEGRLAVAGAINQWMTGTAAGEAVLRGETALWLGVGASGGIKIGTSGAVRLPQLSTGLAHIDSSGNVTSSGVVVGDFASQTANRLIGTGAAGVGSLITLPAAGITLSSSAIALANDIAAVEALASTGFAVRTATDTWAQRTIVGTANEITVTNGDGVAGSPTLSIPSALSLNGKTLSGTIAGTPTFSGANFLTLANIAQAAAFTLTGNTTGSTANRADFTIGSLTDKASPAAGDYVMIADNAASGALKRVNVSALASAGSVSSIDGATGAFTISGLLARSTNDLRVLAATQAEQETGSSTTVAVTPGRQQYHPSAVKVWARWNAAGTLAASYNVSSITDNGAGNWTVNFTTAFSSGNYGIAGMAGYSASTGLSTAISNSPASGSCAIFVINSSGALVDPAASDNISAAFFGDQ